MSEEIKDPVAGASEGKPSEEEPQVFTVHRSLNRWRFSRRDFLSAASAATVTGVAGAIAGCEPGAPPVQVPPTATSRPTEVMQITKTPIPAPTLTPTQPSTPTAMSTPAATPTPVPTKSPPPTPSPTPAPVAKFMKDVTIPDNTVLEPGNKFTKTWQVKNSGSIEWGEGANLTFRKGEQMGATSPVPIANVKPGETLDISVDMVAPTEPGSYTGEWVLQTARRFRLTTCTVVILVGSSKPITPGQQGIEMQITGPDGTAHTFTLPCGASIPANAVCTCNCVTAPLPGAQGQVKPGETGINFAGPGGETRTMPCGSPLPEGWTCTCNCVTAPPACSCVGHCSCDSQGGHYWHPC